MTSLRPIILLAIVYLACGLSPSAAAQTVTGSLEGRITDQTGAVIPGAAVTIHNVETGQERSVTTNAEGFYRAPFLPLGVYRVIASFQGFANVTQENIQVTLNQTVVANFELKPTATSAEVTIRVDEVQINTTNAEIKQALSAEQISEKPTLNQGSFLTLAEIFTGFQENPTNGQNNPTASSGSSINFNGTGTRGATFQINGVNNDDSSENQHRQGASLATIKEFQVISNNFTAEFGRGYGAVVLVQTKSGTNQIHGEVYEYHNDSFLNAKSHFATNVQKPVSRRNQYGGVAGFPFIENRLFGFLSFDQVRQPGAGNYTRDMLLPNERTPRLSATNDTPANRAFIESVIARFPADLPFNHATISRTHIGSVGFNRPLDDYSVRLDWNPRGSDQIFARHQYTRQIFDNEDIIIGEATKQNNKQQNIGLTWTHIFSNQIVGEFRYGLGLRTTLVGIKAGDDTPIIRFDASPVSGTTLGSAGNFPINRYQTDNQFVYNLSALFGGNHFFKAGADIRRQQLDDLADNFSRGFYTFNATCNNTNYGSAYAAFLAGCVRTFQKGYGPFFLENRIGESNLYAEDNWKIRPNLTLNLGARYEYVHAPREAEERIAYGFGDDKNNFQPRIGFAYSPNWESGWLAMLTGGRGNASLRGGYGIYHGRVFQSVFSQGGATVRFNPPNALFRTFENSLNIADPTNGFVFVPGPQTARHTLTIVDPNLEMPYTQQWNLSFERKVPFNASVRVSYSANRGIGLLRYVQDNLPVSPLAGGIVVANHPNNAPAAGAPDLRGVKIDRIAADVRCAGTGFIPGVPVQTPDEGPCNTPVPIANNEVSFRVRRTNERRPDPRYNTNLVVSNGVWSYYQGLQVEWIKRLSQGLTFSAAYTWSKSIDTTSEATAVGAGDSNFNGPDTRSARALSRYHTPHRLTVFGTYRLSWFDKRNGFAGWALGGWQVSAVMKLAAGIPFTVIDGGGVDLNFDGFTETRPVLLDNSVLGKTVNDPNTSQQILRREAFRPSTFGDFGCCVLGRNTFFVDGVNNFDIGLYKFFKMPFENHRLVFRADMFNAWNHVQYGFPVNNTAASTFGRINATSVSYGPRNVQFSLRYIF
jgi:Carboxypeptidase regulatory-like domain/TonB dependent receptor